MTLLDLMDVANIFASLGNAVIMTFCNFWLLQYTYRTNENAD